MRYFPYFETPSPHPSTSLSAKTLHPRLDVERDCPEAGCVLRRLLRAAEARLAGRPAGRKTEQKTEQSFVKQADYMGLECSFDWLKMERSDLIVDP